MKEKIEKKGLELLREPFPAHQISKLPKPFKKDSPKGNCSECGGYHGLPAMHLDYVGHAALTDRLLDVDMNWSWEPMAFKDGLPAFDDSGGLWIRLTVCGQSRIGYGNAEDASYKDVGAREKEVIGDALRNAAMRFGAALDLWHKGDLHIADEEEKAPVIDKKKAVENSKKEMPTNEYTMLKGLQKGLSLKSLTIEQCDKYLSYFTNDSHEKRMVARWKDHLLKIQPPKLDQNEQLK